MAQLTQPVLPGMELTPQLLWTAHDVSTRHARKKVFYWTLHVGSLDKELASIDTRPKSFEVWVSLPGAGSSAKRKYFKTVEEAQRFAEKLVTEWLTQVLEGATEKEGQKDAGTLRIVPRDDKDRRSGAEAEL